MALKAHHGGRPWGEWPRAYRAWTPDLAANLPEPSRAIASLHTFAQYIFFRQWSRLRAYACERGIRIIGDVPIFVALDSADTWQHREVFRLDEQGRPLASAGVPPDYFSEFGQFWGNPLYDWDRLEQADYAWWIERLRAAFALFDVVRLDHFRGFETYWEIPAGSEDARTGLWRKGPGRRFFQVLAQKLPQARIIAEDLGYVTPEVVELRQGAGLPGMKILQFGYGHDDNNVNLPHFFPRDCVVYTGTHDNNTTRGWIESLSPEIATRVDAYFGLGGSSSAWPMVRAAFSSVARLAVLPMQDLLDLPAEARMNRPGIAEGNWQWRFTSEQLAALSREHCARLRAWHDLYDRKDDGKQREYSAPPAEMDAATVSSHG
jgi:4-alpha-glucanotransferase